MSDEEILAVYRESVDSLYGFVSRRTGGERQLAEDVVQETWVRAVYDWRRRGKTPNQPEAWLKTVARRLIQQHYRRRRPATNQETPLALQEGEAMDAGTPEAAVLVHYGLARLSKRHAAVLEAFHFDGRGVEDIARSFGLSARAVEGRLRRARQSLSRILAPFLRPEESAS